MTFNQMKEKISFINLKSFKHKERSDVKTNVQTSVCLEEPLRRYFLINASYHSLGEIRKYLIINVLKDSPPLKVFWELSRRTLTLDYVQSSVNKLELLLMWRQNYAALTYYSTISSSTLSSFFNVDFSFSESERSFWTWNT